MEKERKEEEEEEEEERRKRSALKKKINKLEGKSGFKQEKSVSGYFLLKFILIFVVNFGYRNFKPILDC